MTDETEYQNNPLHGVSLKTLLTELVDQYDFEILFAYLNINCFKTNPSIASSLKFLKKTEWAREKVESFYLYEFKSLPRASAAQFELPPRMRVIPADQKPGEPAELSFTDAKRLQAKRAKKASEFGKRPGRGGPGGGRNFGAKRGGKASQNRTGYQARQDKRDSSGSSSSSSHSNASAASDDNPWGNWKP